MIKKFIPTNRDQQYLFPPSIRDWLPEEHLARFVVDIVAELNLQPLADAYAGKGHKAYHPEILLSLLFYGYATGVFFSRKIEKATYDSVAFRFISANTHPDHDTIATFRKRFLKELKPLFVQILMLAREMGLLKLGKVDTMLADAGYYSDGNAASCKSFGIEPYIAPNREKHNQPLAARFVDPTPLSEDAEPIDKMRNKLKTVEGRKVYAQRKSTVEPVFGIIKHVLGFRQFFLRGLEAVSGEWTLVSIAWNIKRMFALKV